ncbi:hypothetical protein BGZ63DRAFT_367028 [Mariannaea sp. PMI_226]|nr:hypothetical protein BGZ63DRAFT_367028 [Mariannaea sp. PMI_226]
MTSLEPARIRRRSAPSSATAVLSPKKTHEANEGHHVHSQLATGIQNLNLREDDAELSDNGSNYSSVSEDSLPSIHRYNHKYHGSGLLMTPNDDSEALRLSLQHKLFQLCLDGDLVHTKLPLDDHNPENPLQILDVGTGTGIWACAMALKYPQVNILGVDLTSALLPSDVPANVTFEIADINDPWPPHTYDFIHMRNLVGGGVRDWKSLLSNAFNHLKPGGQLEFTEVRPRFFDNDSDKPDLSNALAGQKLEIGAACLEYQTAFADMSRKMDLDYDPVPQVSGWLTDIGAESIRERVNWLPVKSWGDDPISREKGVVLQEVLDCSLENWTLRLFGLCGWKEEDTRALLERVKQEIQDPGLRSNVQVTFITARKPRQSLESAQHVVAENVLIETHPDS